MHSFLTAALVHGSGVGTIGTCYRVPVVSTTAAVHLHHCARRIIFISLPLVHLIPGVRESTATGSNGADARAVEDLQRAGRTGFSLVERYV